MLSVEIKNKYEKKIMLLLALFSSIKRYLNLVLHSVLKQKRCFLLVHVLFYTPFRWRLLFKALSKQNLCQRFLTRSAILTLLQIALCIEKKRYITFTSTIYSSALKALAKAKKKRYISPFLQQCMFTIIRISDTLTKLFLHRS